MSDFSKDPFSADAINTNPFSTDFLPTPPRKNNKTTLWVALGVGCGGCAIVFFAFIGIWMAFFWIACIGVREAARENPMLQVGETAPEFEIVKIEPLADDDTFKGNGEKLRFSDYSDKYVILDFWATWCGPCLAKLPELKKLYGKIRDDDRFVMIGISLDGANSEEMLGKFVAKQEMNWLQGLSGDWNSDVAHSYGINKIPTLLLVGTDGKVLLSDPGIAELTKKIDELLRP